MTRKIRTRTTKRKLLLHWAAKEEFDLTVNVLPRREPRLLNSYTISIHVAPPGANPSLPQFVTSE